LPVTISQCRTPNLGVVTASDTAGPVTVTNNAPAVFPLGTTTVTWTATDAAGNKVTVTQVVTAILGDDPSCCPPNTNIILGTNGSDVLVGTMGRDCILLRGGNDVCNAFGGDDYISGGDGDDVIDSGDGNDVVFGGAGRDTIMTGNGNDRIDGGPGNDICNAGPGANTVVACEP
jgi:Ca2+-binding RTX toxin-like protein